MVTKKIVRTRIAPSPTGDDLHIGSVYMALINYVFAKQHKGSFIVRIEDTDRERYVEGAEERMLASLDWVGIPHEEGVDLGGAYAPYRQSERLHLYKQYAQELLNKGHAYYCFCTQERLEVMRANQNKQKLPSMYDGWCKNIDSATALKRAEVEPYVIRLRVPDSGVTEFIDGIRGIIHFQNALIDDQVLLKRDGFPTYHLAVVVDDHLMEISHVIRGEEWISSTPKHILLYQAFGWQPPLFAHLPLLRNPDKSKLSKRRNPVWASWFREQGFLPEAILNYLGTLTWGNDEGKDIFTVKEMIRAFSLSKVRTTAPIFDLTKLTWFNGEYIRKMSDGKLEKQLAHFLPKVDSKLIHILVPLAKERMKTLKEFALYLGPFIAYKKITLNDSEKADLQIFNLLFSSQSEWSSKKLYEIAKKVIRDKKMNLKSAFMSLRLAVTGEKVGLPLFESLEILGKEETLTRIKEHF